MFIGGLDLAAQPEGTAMAVLDWASNGAKLVSLQTSVTDNDVATAAQSLTKLGIDCALGWPAEFVAFVTEYSARPVGEQFFDGGIDWRRRLAHRETDREVRRITGRWPLSVSTDRLGMTALRCAGLLSKLGSAGEQIDRAGSGKIVEIYPAATLRLWGFEIAGYRNSTDIRADLLERLRAAAPWLDLGQFAPTLIDSCDAFDSLVAALAAASAAEGASTSPPQDKLSLAKIEGWVALPTGRLQDLVVV